MGRRLDVDLSHETRERLTASPAGSTSAGGAGRVGGAQNAAIPHDHREDAETDFRAVRPVLADLAIGKVFEDALLERSPPVGLHGAVEADEVAIHAPVEED